MNLQKLWNDDDAVSPVIGVILMVAITVILAAVIATFVLGLGEQVSQTAPQASFSFDYDSDASDLTVTHNGGETLEPSQVFVNGTTWNGEAASNVSQVSAGDSLTVGSVASTDTVRVTWESQTGDTSATLSEWKGPDA